MASDAAGQDSVPGVGFVADGASGAGGSACPEGGVGSTGAAGADSGDGGALDTASPSRRVLREFEIGTASRMEQLGEAVGSQLRAGDLLVLDGPLGAGKTTLTRGIGRGLGVRGPITSPTFVLARTHPSLVGGPALVHVDAYRLGDSLEFDDLDIDAETAAVVVEWGADYAQQIAEHWVLLSIVPEQLASPAAATAEPERSAAGGTAQDGVPGDAASGARDVMAAPDTAPRRVRVVAVGATSLADRLDATLPAPESAHE